MKSSPALDLNITQWRVLHSVMLKTMFRAERGWGKNFGTSPSQTKRQTIEVIRLFAAYTMIGLFGAMLVSIATPPFGEFLAISTISYFTLSNLKTTFRDAQFLTRSMESLGVFPISPKTYLASYVSSAIAYECILCLVMAGPPWIVILAEGGFLSGLGWLLSTTFNALFLCFVATSIAMLFRPNNVSPTSRTISLFLGTGCFLAFITLAVVVTAYEDALKTFGDPWNLTENNILLLFPPYWFLSLYLLFSGTVNSTTIIGSVLATLGFLPVALHLISRFGAHSLAEISEKLLQNNRLSERMSSKFPSKLVSADWKRRETSVIWKVAFSHLRFDSAFRHSLSAFLPVLILFVLLIPILEDGLPDPFSDPPSAATANFVLSFALSLAALSIVDTCRASHQFRASWLLLMSPTRLSSHAIGLIDWVFATFVIPFLVLLTVAFAFLFDSSIHAFLLTSTLAWQIYVIVSLKVALKPALPFLRNPGSGSVSSITFLSFAFAAIAALVISYSLADWIYGSYASYALSMLIGGFVCIVSRYVARLACDREFRYVEVSP